MNFVPSAPDRVLHDTWVFVRDAETHLFYLAPQAGNNLHRLIGHAISTNWLDWDELPSIELTGCKGQWDSGRIGTGHVFRYDDGRYYMAYTGRIDPQEDIGLAVSDDLVTWQKVSTSPVWPQATCPPYETHEAAPGLTLPWRDPFVVRDPTGEWEAYVCARTDRGPLAGRACVGRCRLDAVDRWRTLAPVATTGEYAMMEVPEIFAFGGRHWLTFNTGSPWGRRLDTTRRPNASGTFYLVADAWNGPWRTPENNVLIGSAYGRRDAVVARSVEIGGERIVYHHFTGSIDTGSDRAMGLPKVLAVDGDRLLLNPWPGLRGLWHRPIQSFPWQTRGSGPLAGGAWGLGTEAVRGSCAVGGTVCIAETGAADIDLELRLCIREGARAGVAVRLDGDGGRGLLAMLDARRDEVTLGRFRREGGSGPYLDDVFDRVHMQVCRDRQYAIRLIVRDRYAELFVDDELLFSTIVGRVGQGTCIGCVADEANAEFSVERAHELRPMPRP